MAPPIQGPGYWRIILHFGPIVGRDKEPEDRLSSRLDKEQTKKEMRDTMKPWKITIYQFENGNVSVINDDTEEQMGDLCGPAPTALGKIMIWLVGKLQEHEHQTQVFYKENITRTTAVCYICLVTKDLSPEDPLIMVDQPKRSRWHRWVHRSCLSKEKGG